MKILTYQTSGDIFGLKQMGNRSQFLMKIDAKFVGLTFIFQQ